MKVVAASVAIKWVYEEKSGVQTARALLARPELLIAPPIWLLEVGDVIQRRSAVISCQPTRPGPPTPS